jgi:hypothetical protein
MRAPYRREREWPAAFRGGRLFCLGEWRQGAAYHASRRPGCCDSVRRPRDRLSSSTLRSSRARRDDQRGRPPRAGAGDINRDVFPRDVARASVGLVQQGAVKLGTTTTTSHFVVVEPLFYSTVDNVRVARPLDLSADEDLYGHSDIMLLLPSVEH